MPQDVPITPPYRKPIQELRSPDFKDGFFTELVNRQDSAYQKVWPIPRGTPYAGILGSDQRVIDYYANNPLFFLKQTRPGNSSSSDFGSADNQVIWVWATDQLAQDTFNSEITYEEEGVTYPVFVREYDVRRKQWEANPTLAVATSLTCLLSVNLTGAGTGYTQATGTIGNATAQAVCFNGQIIDWIVTIEGSGIASGAALVIVGDGTGATATARIQPASAVLVHQEKQELPDDNLWGHDYVRIVRQYMTLPGPTLTTYFVSDEVRGTPVLKSIHNDLLSSLVLSTGDYIISDEIQPLNTVVGQQTSTSFQSVLPPDESWAYWDWVALPFLLFDITNIYYCNNSQFFKIVTQPVTALGSTQFRKHRRTVSYSLTAPDTTPDESTSAFETTDIRYQGNSINFAFSNALNDSISYSQSFYSSASSGTCFWTEAYSFSATSPSATDFYSGMWVTKQVQVLPFGTTMFKLIKDEYYSIQGNPSI